MQHEMYIAGRQIYDEVAPVSTLDFIQHCFMWRQPAICWGKSLCKGTWHPFAIWERIKSHQCFWVGYCFLFHFSVAYGENRVWFVNGIDSGMLNTGGSATLPVRSCQDASFSCWCGPNIPLNRRELELTASVSKGRNLRPLCIFNCKQTKESTGPVGQS